MGIEVPLGGYAPRLTTRQVFRSRSSLLLRGLVSPNSQSATFALRIGFSGATAVLVQVGASLEVAGRSGAAGFLAVVAGLLGLPAGALNTNWQAPVPLG